ncbi:hypothetical protein OGZ01_10990 [Vibrio harveyi]|nr:hypothetical protein [Vibrio harveyi]
MESKKNENLQVVGDSVTINHIQSSDKDESKAKKWLVPLVTTLIGIVATIIVAWYQLKVGEEQAFQAAIEREKAVHTKYR